MPRLPNICEEQLQVMIIFRKSFDLMHCMKQIIDANNLYPTEMYNIVDNLLPFGDQSSLVKETKIATGRVGRESIGNRQV